nr:excalibur calcium-binding domain-containing protein [Candidatus Symbiopectobacterium sp. 'North America']
MRSQKEAYFFLQNCPNTKMDGDKDGEPCEKYRYPEGVRRD